MLSLLLAILIALVNAGLLPASVLPSGTSGTTTNSVVGGGPTGSATTNSVVGGGPTGGGSNGG